MRRVSLPSIFVFSIGQAPSAVKDAIFQLFFFFYFTAVKGVDPALVGVGNLIIMMFDAISDPLMGYISDNFKSKFWGRRHLFMVLAVVPLAATLSFLLNPVDGLDTWGLMAWMIGFAVLVRTFLTMFTVPYLALGAEMSEDYNQRTTISAIRNMAGFTASIGLSFAAFIMILTASEAYPDGRLNGDRYVYIGMLAGAVTIITGLIATFGTRHLIPNLPAAPIIQRKWWTAYTDLLEALTLKSFRTLVSGFVTYSIMGGLVTALILHLVTYFWQFTTEQSYGFVLSTFAGALLATFFVPIMAKMFGKRWTVILCLLGFSFGLAFPIIVKLSGVLPHSSDMRVLLFAMTCSVISNIFSTGILIMVYSMMADVVDEHELKTGLRQEGMFFAANSFATKVTFGVGGFFAGISMRLIGFPSSTDGLKPEDVPADVLFKFGLVFGPMVTVIALIPIFFFWRYDLNEAKHATIMAKIQARRET